MTPAWKVAVWFVVCLLLAIALAWSGHCYDHHRHLLCAGDDAYWLETAPLRI